LSFLPAGGNVNIRDLAEQFHIIPVTEKANGFRRPKSSGGFLAGFQQFALPGKEYFYFRYGFSQCRNLPYQKNVIFTRDKFGDVQ
jgi:hypothetical protein